MSKEPFWGKIFIEKTVIYKQFWTLSKNFWPFVKVSSWGCQKCNLCVCIRTFVGENEFSKDLHFCLYIFGHTVKFLAFHRKSFNAVIKTAFCLSFRTFWGYKKSLENEIRNEGEITFCPFSNIGQKISDILTKTFPRGFQNCIPRLHLKLSEEERFFLKKVICLIIFSGNWRKNSRNCSKLFSASYHHCFVSIQENISRKDNSTEKKKHFYNFRTLSIFFVFFIENIWQVIEITSYLSMGKTRERKKLDV